MILPLHDRVRDRVRAVLTEIYGIGADESVAVALEYPPNRLLGDLGSPIAFELARRLRKAPRAIAQEIAAAIGDLPGIARVDAAPNGYLNVFLDRSGFLLQRLGLTPGLPERPARPGKAIVEHTAINPNKAAHIGHVRNSALGDTLVRVLRFRGSQVEVQNYIDDTGVQVADVVVGFQQLEGLDLDGVRRLADTTRFDYTCWDLYARVGEWYGSDKARLALRAQALHDIEHGTEPTATLAAFIADRIVRCHLVTMGRLSIDYDLLTWEGDILRLHFWARAFEKLKASGAVYLQNEGRLAGCWVMRIEDEDEDEDENKVPEVPRVPEVPEVPVPNVLESIAERSEGEEDTEREKVIVRSNGTVTYVGKDMAYQLWKSGLAGYDFHYRPFGERLDGRVLWATTSHADAAAPEHPHFGGGTSTYNVIDVRQSYLQKLLKQALVAIGHPREAEGHTHFSYEMVALSHATARELGFAPPPDSEEAKKPFVEVSGRKGLGVKADDLLDRLIEKVLAEVASRSAKQPPAEQIPPGEQPVIANTLAVAAIRYFMVKYSRTKVIAFDIDEALAFVGESGPYLQYAVVRANNIFQKLHEREGLSEADVLQTLSSTPPAELDGANGDHELWALVLEASRLDDVVEQVVRSLELSVLAKYAFGLAQTFNAFYHKAPILNEERQDVRRWRAAAVAYFRQQLTSTLELMGVTVPPRM